MVKQKCAIFLVKNIGTLKFIFHICNLLCAFACIQLIVFGIANLMDIEELDALPTDQNIDSPHIVSIILGAFLLINSCYGFMGAARQLPLSMNCYTLMQMNIFVFCIITIWISDIEESMANAFQYVWHNRFTNHLFELCLSRIQWKLGCCGMNGPGDYYENNSTTWLNSCRFPNDITNQHYAETPCQFAVGDWALTVYIRFVSSLVATAALTFVTFILSFYFTSAIVLKPFIEQEQHVINEL